MPKIRFVCIAAGVLLSLAGTLSACSSDRLPPQPQAGHPDEHRERSRAPASSEPLAPLQLSGGQAVKALLDPVTGELREPSEIERPAPDGISRLPACPSTADRRGERYRCGVDGTRQPR
jgi:hypothetical protein